MKMGGGGGSWGRWKINCISFSCSHGFQNLEKNAILSFEMPTDHTVALPFCSLLFD